MRRVVLLATVAFLVCVAPGSAAADTCRPLNEGGMVFGLIQGPEDPEDYCYEVSLGDRQELEQIDDRHVAVVYSNGFQSTVLIAKEAHDSEGAAVPTSLAKTGENDVTLTVHHREGNPLAGGAPFHYPVVGGAGWEGGFRTIEAQMSPAPSAPPAEEAATPQCVVPHLHGESLRAARSALLGADCRLGPIHGTRSRGARVVKQYRRSGAVLPAGTEVGVKLA